MNQHTRNRHSKGIREGGRFAPDETPAAPTDEPDTLTLDFPTDMSSVNDAEVVFDPVADLYDKMTYDDEGYDGHGYNRDGFHRNAGHRNGTRHDDDGYNNHGFNTDGFNRDGNHFLTADGYDDDGYNRDGFDKDGNSRHGVAGR